MKKQTIILISIIGLLLLGLSLCIKTILDQRTILGEVKNGVQNSLPPTTHKVDENGSEHAIVPDEGISREAGDILYGQLLDSIAKLNKLKSGKQINSYDEYSIRKNAPFTGKVDPPVCDSTGDTTQKLTFSGSNFSGTGQIKKNGEVTGSLSLRLQLARANYWEKKWFLGDRHFYENLWSADTTVHIDTIKHIRISEAEFSRWSVSCFAGYDLLNMKPAAGVALSYEIFRFKKRKHKK